MTIFLGIIAFFLTIGICAYFRFSRVVWISVIAALLVLLSFYSQTWLARTWLTVGWGLFLTVAIAVTVTPIRCRVLVQPIFKLFKKLLPPIGETERIAIEEGDTWWEADLFSGQPNWQKLRRFQTPTLTKEEQSFLDNQTETLCKMLDDWKITHYQFDLPQEIWNYIKQEKFWGLVTPKNEGGLGFSPLAHSTIVTKIASRSVTAAVTVMVPNSLGPAELLHYYGTEEQKKRYVQGLAEGKEIPCFGLTAPEAGSDAASMIDHGVVCKGQFEGKEVLGIKLTWNKRYITLAPIATVLGIAFKLSDPDELLKKGKNLGITLCLLPTSHPGVVVGERHYPLTMPFMNGTTHGTDVFIPIDYVIGGKDMVGQGWRMLMECLSIGRAISLPAMATATGMLSYRMTGAYAFIRKQFKLPIGKFEGVEEALARIGGYSYLLESCRMLTMTACNQNLKPAIISAISKYHMTEMARKVINDAMDVHGGKAIQMGPENYLANAYISMPIGITVEGANILTRNLIIFGQGVMRCHPYLRHEIDAVTASETQQGLKTFDALFMKHLGFALSNGVRTKWMGLTGGHLILINGFGKSINRLVKQLTRMSSALAFTTELMFLILGGNLKRRERISARLGDVLSYLYLASSVLKFYVDHGKQEQDLPYVKWSLQTCLYEIQQAFQGIFSNLSNKWLGCFLYRAIFPWNGTYKKPSDQLDHQIAKHMMTTSELRDRLTRYCFIGDAEKDATAKKEKTFVYALQADAIQRKLKEAFERGEIPKQASQEQQLELALKTGLFTYDDVAILEQAEKLIAKAIQVDAFSKTDPLFATK